MAITHAKSRRKATGGRYKQFRSKRVHEVGNQQTDTKLAETIKKKVDRGRGGNTKTRLMHGNVANVYNPETKKYQNVKIIDVLDNPADRNFIRKDIMTKGAIIETEAGKAKITSRPGQVGVINAVVIKE